MRINFLVNEVSDGWEPTNTRLGGTEESVVKWAEEFVKQGHSVWVYYNQRTYGMKQELGGGVMWVPRTAYSEFEPVDICINIKSSEVAPKEPTLYLTNETNASDLDLSAYKGVIWPSQWAVDNIPVNNQTFIVPHGYSPTKIYSEKKIRKQCLYASSPDRGLDTLLEAWPKVAEVHPDAILLVTYGALPRDIKNVIFMGDLPEDVMNELYRTSEYWLHPCSGGELYGMTGIKAQAAGCWPIYFPTMALSETVQFGTKSTPETLDRDIIRELGQPHEIPKVKLPTWKDSTQALLNVVESVLER